MTDYDRDLARIDGEVARIESDPSAVPAAGERARQLAYGRYQRAALTGDPRELLDVEPVIDTAIERAGPWPDLYLLKANLDFKLHRLSGVRKNLALASSVSGSPAARILEAELLVQAGRYQEARAIYDGLNRDCANWDVLARMAHVQMRLADFEGADRLYLEAEDELTAKEMRSYAWVEVQRGVLDFVRGRHDEADRHYTAANSAYSGYWEVEQRIAELHAAEGKLDQAIALYLDLVRRHPKPELQEALGTLFRRRGQPREADSWHSWALATYRASAERGEVHYVHHLAEFYSEVARNGAEAVHWARLDLELRPGPSTRAALAWALYRDGQYEAALDAMQQALESGLRDPHLLSQAVTIFEAAGREDEAYRYRLEASGR